LQEEEFVQKISILGGKAYIAGGWVRDIFLKKEGKDKDYVISGVDEKTFLAVFSEARKIGRSFPVYLMEIEGVVSEIAFARKEKKEGQGYRGFQITYDVSVKIAEDLYRRDTTMNSMAMELPDRVLIDPYGGREDIAKGCIRATSSHFREDPVRALRAARQAAELGFVIEDGTIVLMRACRDELLLESQDRFLRELSRALQSKHPVLFFRALQKAGLLEIVFPEIYSLIGKLQNPVHHPEGDAFEHTMLVLEKVAAETESAATRFAALVHDIGKGAAKINMLTHYYEHEIQGEKILVIWNRRMTLPKLWLQCGLLVIREHMRAPLLNKAGKIVALLLTIEKSKMSFAGFNTIILADHGDLPEYLSCYEKYISAILRVNGKKCPQPLQGKDIGRWIRNEQIKSYLFIKQR